MKFTLLLLSVAFMSFFLSGMKGHAQCTPLSAEECPDPENNGEVCPDSLAHGYLNLLYSQVATILAPLSDTNGIPIHHLTLQSVDNLPPGLTFQTNAANNEFLAGNYYCILMEGTPQEAGTFDLKIIVDIYINFFGVPVYALTVTDSTSLAIQIIDNTGVPEDGSLAVTENFPNPFNSWTSFRLQSGDAGPAGFSMYDLQGRRLAFESFRLVPGEQFYHFNGEHLPPGTYVYTITAGSYAVRGLIVRQNRD